jgi:hypothetical protein
MAPTAVFSTILWLWATPGSLPFTLHRPRSHSRHAVVRGGSYYYQQRNDDVVFQRLTLDRRCTHHRTPLSLHAHTDTGASSLADVDPNAAFEELLTSQLAIVTTSTSASFAAIFIGDARVVSHPPSDEWDASDALGPALRPGEARFPIVYNGQTFGVLQTFGVGGGTGTGPPDDAVVTVAQAVAKSIGLSIAVEMARQGTLEEFDRAIRDIVALESDAWLRASSALMTSRTLLQMVALRLSPDDDVGREMISNVLDQTDSVAEALALLSHEEGGGSGDGGRGEKHALHSSSVVEDYDDHDVGIRRRSSRNSPQVYDVDADAPEPNTSPSSSSSSFFGRRQTRASSQRPHNGGKNNDDGGVAGSIWEVSKDEVDVDWSDGSTTDISGA